MKVLLRRRSAGFTLVELLVVIAIIGILVALLLPAVQAAREAARRTQCRNQLKQMGLAVLNLESALGAFPSGGIEPWPDIVNYQSGGKAFGPDRQGLSWAFQILPYLEESAVHDLNTTAQIEATPVEMYFCPSRRQPTQSTTGRWLMDYAALQPAPSRSQIGDAAFDALLAPVTAARNSGGSVSSGCSQAYGFWGTKNYANDFTPAPADILEGRDNYTGFWGVIVRSSYLVRYLGREPIELGYPQLTTFGKILDGASNTGMIAEKRWRSDASGFDTADDDRGWSDGWDLDTIRSTICNPNPDGPFPLSDFADVVSPGASHTAGIHVVFADGSVRSLSYDIDLETFNRIGNRADGEIIDESL